MRRAALLGPAVFGAMDGANTILGVVGGVPAGQLVKVCALAAASAGVSMATGSWLSKEGRRKSLVLGAATAGGTVLPALPFTLWSGRSALVGVAVVLVLLGAVISVVRTRIPVADGQPAESLQSLPRAAAETFTVLVLVCAVVAVCALATGSPG